MPQADLFQQIRTQFQEKTYRPLSTGGRTKVLARNDVHFISELPNKWRVDYERRQDHKHTGFFSYNHLPYKTFGNLKHTDVYDLMGDRLGITVTKQHAYSHVYNRHHFIQDHDGHPNNTFDPQQTIKVFCRPSQCKSHPDSRNAGLSSLCLALGANERSIREMNTGSAFRDVLKREEERNIFLEEIRAPKVVRQQEGQSCQVHNPSLFLPQMVHTASSKACLTLSDAFHKKPPGGRRGGRRETQEAQAPEPHEAEVETESELEDAVNRTRGVGANLYVALAAAHFKLHHTAHEKVQEHNAQTSSICNQQKRRKCLAKVKLVHTVLSCLHNIRMRDLRSKEPLKAEVISTISQCPLHSLTRDTYDAHHHHPHHPHLHHYSRYDTHTPTLLHHHRLPSISHHHGGLLTHEHSLDGAHRHHTHHTHHTRHHTHLTPHHKPHGHGTSRHVKVRAGSGLETWEDILSIDAGTWVKGHAHQHANTTHGPHSPHSATAQHHQKTARQLPPWQRQVIYVDTDDDNKRHCPVRQIHGSVDAFQHCKNELAQGLRDTLTTRKRHLQKHLVAKLQALPLRVGAGSAEKCLEEMSEGAYHTGCEEVEGEEKEKPAWYVQLEKELNGMCEPRKDAEVKGALEKLWQFASVDSNTIHHAIDKLCLLVMSLPANLLCLEPVVRAIEFVLEHILKAPPELYSQWLDLRQLPHITTELPQHAYVFGMSL